VNPWEVGCYGRTNTSTSRGIRRNVRSRPAGSWHDSAVLGHPASQRASKQRDMIGEQKVQCYCTVLTSAREGCGRLGRSEGGPIRQRCFGSAQAPPTRFVSREAASARLSVGTNTRHTARGAGSLHTPDACILGLGRRGFDCPPPASAFERTPRRSRVACQSRDGQQAVAPRLSGLGVPRDRLVGSTCATGSAAIRSWPRICLPACTWWRAVAAPDHWGHHRSGLARSFSAGHSTCGSHSCRRGSPASGGPSPFHAFLSSSRVIPLGPLVPVGGVVCLPRFPSSLPRVLHCVLALPHRVYNASRPRFFGAFRLLPCPCSFRLCLLRRPRATAVYGGGRGGAVSYVSTVLFFGTTPFARPPPLTPAWCALWSRSRGRHTPDVRNRPPDSVRSSHCRY